MGQDGSGGSGHSDSDSKYLHKGCLMFFRPVAAKPVTVKIEIKNSHKCMSSLDYFHLKKIKIAVTGCLFSLVHGKEPDLGAHPFAGHCGEQRTQ